MAAAAKSAASVAEPFASVTSPDGTHFEVYDASTGRRTAMDVVFDGTLVRTFASYGLAVEAIDSGLLDELIQPDEPAPPAQPGIITQRTEPATEQEITDLLAVDTWPLPSAELELDWQERALCTQSDPEAFFPEKGGSSRAAKAVCLACPVRAACLDYALRNDERFGIWGGLTERERRRVKKGTLDPQTILNPQTSPVPAPPPSAPAPEPVVAEGAVEEAAPAEEAAPVEEAAAWVPAEPVLCAAPGCTQLVTVEFIRRTGQRIHPPCLARLSTATTSTSVPEPGRQLAGAGAGGRS